MFSRLETKIKPTKKSHIYSISHVHSECPHFLTAIGRNAVSDAVGGVCSTRHAVTRDGLHGLQVPLLCSQRPLSLEDGLSQVQYERTR